MSESGTLPRISVAANRGVTGALFALAIISFTTRTYIRARILEQFSTEDALLLFAVICLCCLTGLGYSSMQNQYDSLAVILNGAESSLLFTILDELPRISKEENAAATLWWFVIVPVKLAYLFFFRRLINRLRDLNIWWWVVVAFVVPAGLVLVAVSWLTCPYFTAVGVLSCSGPSADRRVVRNTIITTTIDVVTDLLVVSFPIALLWRVRINMRQKIGLGVSLCLSLVMGAIAITRISGIYLAGGAVDIVWLIFWQQQECSIAVIMVSVSAFRSFFVVNASKKNSPKDPSSSNSWRIRLLQKRLSTGKSDRNADNALPQIPSATLTGMRTMIQGARFSRVWPSELQRRDSLLSAQNTEAQVMNRTLPKTEAGYEYGQDSTEPVLWNNGTQDAFV